MTTGRRRIEQHQLERLRALLGEIIGHNPFYTAKLAGSGVDARLTSLGEFADRVPFTTKQELVDDQQANPPYGTNLTYPIERYTRYCQTSGTTGRPMRWLDTTETWSWMLDCWSRVYEAASVRSSDRVFFPFSFGPFLGFWAAFETATRLGCLAIPGGGMTSAARVRAILHNQVTVLCSTPTYAIRLAEVADEEKLALSGSAVRRIIVAGEPGGSIPATRARIETLWSGARVVDHHGMTEIGPVSYECPMRTGVLHVIESGYYAEVLGDGITGELVLTNLSRNGSPLLRYRTGDMVHLARQAPCECGSCEIALEGGILGRCDDMVVVRGVNIYPSGVEEILRSCGVTEFRAELRTENALPELAIEVEAEGPDAAAAAEAALKDAFGLRVVVQRVGRGVLPRFEGKSQRWIRQPARSR
jgi:phenylacetate-CoA ligase